MMDLTREQILKLEGRELDAAVAEKIMGLNIVSRDWPCGTEPECGCYEAVTMWGGHFPALENYTERGPVYLPKESEGKWWPPRPTNPIDGGESDGTMICNVEPVPFYSTDIAAAWEVVEKMKLKWTMELYTFCDMYRCRFGLDKKEPPVYVSFAPEAICKAALLAILEVS